MAERYQVLISGGEMFGFSSIELAKQFEIQCENRGLFTFLWDNFDNHKCIDRYARAASQEEVEDFAREFLFNSTENSG